MRILLGYQSYLQRSKASTGQRLVNLYAEKNPEGSKYPFTIYNTPGYVVGGFVDTGSSKPIQGMRKMGGLLYVVTGNEVFKVTTAGVKTSLGTITIASTDERVMMTNNGTQMTILTADGTAWAVTSSTFAQITDPDFPSSSSVTTLDSYTIASKVDSGQFNISSLLDTTAWDALEFATAEEKPDNLVRVFAFNGALWLFGEESYEVYYNSGNAEFPFDQIAGAVNTTRGCAAKHSVVESDNRMFFLGDDRIVYSVIGYNVTVASQNSGVESAFNDYTTVSDAFAFVTELDGHKFYNILFPSENAAWALDLLSGSWSERESRVGDNPGIWSANAHEKFAEKQLIGHNANGIVYELSPTTYTEDGTTIERIVDGSVQWKDGQRITYDRVRLDMDAGVGLATGQGSDPQVMMSYSNDGGQTFSNEKWRSFGKIGEFIRRAIWRRLGAARERIFRFKITDPVPVRITGCYANGRIGRE